MISCINEEYLNEDNEESCCECPYEDEELYMYNLNFNKYS